MSSLQVKSVLRQLGDDIRTARKKRRLPVADFCKRIGVTDKTLKKLESGDPGVRLETLAMALLVLGELDRLKNLIDPARDETGLSLDQQRLPIRIKAKSRIAGMSRSPQGSSEIELDLSDDEGTGF